MKSDGTRRTVQHSMQGVFVFVLLGFFAVLSMQKRTNRRLY